MFRPKRPSPTAPRNRMVSNVVSLPAPVAGLNVRDSVAQMDPRYAVEMSNLWPSAWGVQIRRGWKFHTAMPSGTTVQSLMVYHPPTGVQALFAADSTGVMYDVTLPNVPPVLEFSVAGGHVHYVNFGNVFNNFLVCVNGAIAPFAYNGTSWQNSLAITNDAVADQITLNPADLDDITSFKRRLWFVEKDSSRAWYLPVDVIEGVASLFDLAEVFPRGGKIMDVGTWTVDTGAGMNDLLVFVSSEGDVVIFSGIDPDNDFELVGVFTIAQPINKRSMEKRGGDLLIATQEGIVSIAGVLQEQSSSTSHTISEVIKPLLAFLASALDGIDLQTWTLQHIGRYEMLIYNVSDRSGLKTQFAMNTTTKAWTRFTGVPAFCWAELEGEPYFGGLGFVGRFWTGGFDGSPADGSGEGSYINGTAVQAFQHFDKTGAQKHFRMARPIFRAGSPPSVAISMSVDYTQSNTNIADDPGVLGFDFGVWDVTNWDESLWGLAAYGFSEWYNVGAIGMTGGVSISLKCATVDCFWLSTDIVMESGGTL